MWSKIRVRDLSSTLLSVVNVHLPKEFDGPMTGWTVISCNRRYFPENVMQKRVEGGQRRNGDQSTRNSEDAFLVISGSDSNMGSDAYILGVGAERSASRQTVVFCLTYAILFLFFKGVSLLLIFEFQKTARPKSERALVKASSI